MEDIIKSLEARYGPQHDYTTLTDSQKDFLANRDIINYCDNVGDPTIHIKDISNDTPPILSITDVWSYRKMKDSRNAPSHAHVRLPEYKRITGDNKPDEQNTTYTFTLNDQSTIEVIFDSIRDRT